MADVFVGFAFDEEKEQELLCLSKCGVSAAANQYQKGFLSGLPESVRILTTLSTGAFPRLNKRLFFSLAHKQTPVGEITYLPFINFYFVRDWMFRRGLYRELSRVAKEQEHTTVYVYSLYLPSLRAMDRLKKKYGDRVHYCLIIPDLPGKYGIVRRGIKGLRDRREVKAKLTLPRRADSFVFLTEAMKGLFPHKPYAVIEGFLPQCEFNYANKRQPKSVLYTGSLNEAFGIGTLLDAFAQISDEDAQLWVCGTGDMEDAVRQAAQQDGRIQYKGFLPKSEIADLQTRCDVLVNPRPDEGEYTKYSFPSKTMEYLLSGSKVVMHRLSGIPEEYYRYIRTPEDNTPTAMANVLTEAWADMEFYANRGREQVDWIQTGKNAKQQVSKALQQLQQAKGW